MSPVPSSTVHTGSSNDADEASTVPPVAPRPEGGAQALPSDALDFAAKMFDLARQGSLDLVAYVQAGLPPNLTNNRGDTLLMLAAYHGHTELVKALLSLSSEDMRIQHTPSNPNVLNGRGQSILAGAVFKGHDEVIKVLVQYGADPVAGQPNAEDSAKMFNKWEDDGDKKGLKDLFLAAPGRDRGAQEAPQAVPDREEQRRVPGQQAQT
ncbi:hypothetical protein CBS101457_006504 [Exobasidium rhododendri]|nr:hypothetical protein CBS101457_006504 [Exobasidium rhododendri]